ncbi:neuronal pentraxin-2-like [Macrobrachium rosenbergii]|uniref:neuronal pentraxin-2-like n=1 Tax=Macrobrachium rosenbergii TaxID=79674 RepID=UPI0034D6CD5E
MKMNQKLNSIPEMILGTAIITILTCVIHVYAQFTTQRGGNGPSSSRVLILQESGEPSSRSYARLTSSFPDVRSFSICYRMQMYRFREETTLLSYALDSKDDVFRIDHLVNEFRVAIHGQLVTSNLTTPIRYWAHFCLTVNADSSEWAVYLDGKLADNGQYPEPLKEIKGGGVLVIGQEQDVVGGGFQKDQSYSGEITEISIWRFILNSDSIARLSNCEIYEEGDALSWSRLSWQLYGEVSWAGRSRDILCAPTSRRVTFFPDRFTLPDAIHLCEVINLYTYLKLC